MLKTFMNLCLLGLICTMARPSLAIEYVEHTQSQSYARDVGYVVTVVSGEMIDVRIGERLVRVRLLGVATSAIGSPVTQCIPQQATNYLNQLLQGRMVSLEADPLAPDYDANSWRRYVWVNGQLANLLLIQAGYAVASQEVPFQQETQFWQAEQEAQANYRGLWNSNACGLVERPSPYPPYPPYPPQSNVSLGITFDLGRLFSGGHRRPAASPGPGGGPRQPR